MKRRSDKSIIPKIIIILGSLSILGIILLFVRSRPEVKRKAKRPETPEKLFTQVMEAAKPAILSMWEGGDRLFPKAGVNCPDEIVHEKIIGRSYYQCNPHFWQCYWQKGVKANPAIEIDLFGQTFHLEAKANFNPIPAFSQLPRFYELQKQNVSDLPVKYGYVVEFGIREIPGLTQPMILSDSCRDTYLPQRIYGYSKPKNKRENGFIWDNFDRDIFIDKFYVTNRQVNEWRLLTNQTNKIEADRKKWAKPAFLNEKDQTRYCAFYGKRVLEAMLFDAATMTPSDLKDPMEEKVLRPDTPWQRDLSKTFLGLSRINPDYQLTPLDCQLAQVQGCHEKFFSTDSSTWMGFHFALGFFPEHLNNFIEPAKNLKMSSRFMAPASPWHELGSLSNWNGEQPDSMPVAFRCYEEVVP